MILPVRSERGATGSFWGDSCRTLHKVISKILEVVLNYFHKFLGIFWTPSIADQEEHRSNNSPPPIEVPKAAPVEALQEINSSLEPLVSLDGIMVTLSFRIAPIDLKLSFENIKNWIETNKKIPALCSRKQKESLNRIYSFICANFQKIRNGSVECFQELFCQMSYYSSIVGFQRKPPELVTYLADKSLKEGIEELLTKEKTLKPYQKRGLDYLEYQQHLGALYQAKEGGSELLIKCQQSLEKALVAPKPQYSERETIYIKGVYNSQPVLEAVEVDIFETVDKLQKFRESSQIALLSDAEMKELEELYSKIIQQEQSQQNPYECVKKAICLLGTFSGRQAKDRDTLGVYPVFWVQCTPTRAQRTWIAYDPSRLFSRTKDS